MILNTTAEIRFIGEIFITYHVIQMPKWLLEILEAGMVRYCFAGNSLEVICFWWFFVDLVMLLTYKRYHNRYKIFFGN